MVVWMMCKWVDCIWLFHWVMKLHQIFCFIVILSTSYYGWPWLKNNLNIPIVVCLNCLSSAYEHTTYIRFFNLYIKYCRNLSCPFLPGGLSGRNDATAVQASASPHISDWLVVANEDISTSGAAACQSEQTADWWSDVWLCIPSCACTSASTQECCCRQW